MEYIGSLKFDEKLKKAEQIVIFGAGKMCKTLIEELKDIGIEKKIMGICDNNISLSDCEIQNFRIYAFPTALKQFPAADYIVYNRYAKEICEQLVKNGISKIHLIRR